MGVPLINAIYENNANVGLYTLPLLIWHPMQLVIGSALAPRIADWVEREEKRLEAEKQNSEDTNEGTGDIECGANNDTCAE
jgi:sodium/bile acid cotransporter 7